MSDVAIVHKGVALVRTDAAQVVSCEVLGAPADPPKRLGDAVVELRWTFADGHTSQLAVADSDVDRASGGSQHTAPCTCTEVVEHVRTNTTKR